MPYLNHAKVLQIIKILFPILLFILIMIEIYKIVSHTDFNLVKHELLLIPHGKLVAIMILSICGIIPMILYDLILYKSLRVKISNTRMASQAFITNTFSNIMGFGGAIGLALRSYFLSQFGIERKDLIKKITSVTLFTISGMSILSWIVLIGYRDLSIFVDMKWATIAIGILTLYLPILISIQYFSNKKAFDIKMILQLVGASILEWLFFFLVLVCLVKSLHIPISITQLFPLFIIAVSVGIISLIPGGAGSFDLVFLLSLGTSGVSHEQVLALLILFRLCYYFLPFIIGIFIFINEIHSRWKEKK